MVSTHLTGHLLGRRAAHEAQGVRDVRVDHVLLDQASGTLAWLGFEALQRERVGCDLVLTCVEREPAGPDDADDVRYLASASRRFGGRFARPGVGPAAAVYERRFAMPGRVLLSAARGAAGAGAFGALVIEGTCDALAIAMAGEPWCGELPAVIGVHVEGERPACVRGEEILRALATTFDRRGAGAVLEFAGGGLAALGMSDRLAIARLAPTVLGVCAALFPADEVTRAWLRARGRESDWRRLDTGGRGFDNEWVLPLRAVGEQLEPGRSEPDGARVCIGPFADDAVLRAWAAAATRARGTGAARAEVRPAGRAQQSALTTDGTWARLEAAADVLSPDTRGPVDPMALLVGSGPDDPGRPVGLDTAWASALRGRRVDPRDGDRELQVPDGSAALEPGEILEPGREHADMPLEHGHAHGHWPRPEPWNGAWSGEVLHVHPGALDAAVLLAYGPRLSARRGDPGFLASSLLGGPAGAFAAAALSRGGGALVLKGGMGEGPELEAAARALVAVGVRVVLARRHASGARRALARHGILPGRWVREEDVSRLAAGDEIEIPGLPDGLDVDVPLALRHRTRGIAMSVEHDLGPREVEWVRAGGWLEAVRLRGPSAMPMRGEPA